MKKLIALTTSLLASSGSALAFPQAPFGTVKSEQKISDTRGGFDGVLSNGDSFG